MEHGDVLYAELRCNYGTFVPFVCVVTGGGKSGCVVTVAGGGMDDVSRRIEVREGGEWYQGTAVRNWGLVSCVGTDDR